MAPRPDHDATEQNPTYTTRATHLWVRPHHLLGAVPVVRVDIDDRDAVDRVPPLAQRVQRADGGGVEEGGRCWLCVWVCVDRVCGLVEGGGGCFGSGEVGSTSGIDG